MSFDREPAWVFIALLGGRVLKSRLVQVAVWDDKSKQLLFEEGEVSYSEERFIRELAK